MGTFLSGPLGFLESGEHRDVPPTLHLPLWHCSDPGCRTLHLMKAEQYGSPPILGYKAVKRFLFDHFGRPSEWGGPISRLRRNEVPTSERPYADLPAVLGDCILGDERGVLVKRALCSTSGPMLRKCLAEKRGLRGDADGIANALTAEEQHQLLLVIPDREIVALTDDIIAKRLIEIPPSEVRRPRTYAPIRNRKDSGTQISSLGTESNRHNPLVHLFGRIWNTFEKLGLMDDLAWRISHSKGNASNLRHELMDFLRANGPEAAVKALVLPSRVVTEEIANQLMFTLDEDGDQTKTSRRLLWKFGFRVPRYEDEYETFRNRIAAFKSAAIRLPLRPSESDRADVRSIGVNLFVSVEAMLEDLMVFNLWMLASDHFLSTRFCFIKQDALVLVTRILGRQIQSGTEILRWQVDGTNSLGVLIGYLEAFRRWLKERQGADRSQFVREQKDFPFYADESLRMFPFLHTQLWADVPAETLAAYIELIDSICTQVSHASLPQIRNGLDHKRDEGKFPDADKMLACSTRLEQLTDLADSKGFLPKLLWCVNVEQDLNGNLVRTYADYRGIKYRFYGPSPVPRLREGSPFGVPNIMAPFDFLGLPNSELLFTISPMTDYRKYWENYPRRRYISAATAEIASTLD